MDKEFLILSQLEKNELAPQREIATRTGLAVGTVNLLLKRMARKGLIKFEKMNKRNLRYILTPKGIAEKTRLAYNYAQRSYRLINVVIKAVHKLLAEERARKPFERVILFGDEGDFAEIMAWSLAKENMKHEFVPERGDLPGNLDSTLIVVWDDLFQKQLEAGGMVAANVLDYL
ncbi:MAG: winged helix-turn-helix transcriptional regulator [Firmicutes bacterium]|nr:winged helix-turn-helix transcriptional regulator [Bacillota bacterium]